MRSRNIAAMAFTFLGVLALLHGLSVVQAILMLPSFPADEEVNPIPIYAAYGLSLVLVVSLGAFLIVRRFRLATWLSLDEEPSSGPEPWAWGPELAFSVLGLYLVISTLPTLGTLAAQLISLRAFEGIEQFPQALPGSLGNYVGTLAELVVGAYLFMNAPRVSSWWRRRIAEPAGAPERSGEAPTCPQCGTPFDPGDYRDNAPTHRCSRCGGELLPVPEGEIRS